ncbi:MAG: RimK/LysX family protein [Acidimicrobiia bacterium]|nr:RimK/LysX family protein [Acidimicrobiia bacterium]
MDGLAVARCTRDTGTVPEMVVAGWREWVALPDLGVAYIKAKLDTGARSSSIHAYEPRVHDDVDGTSWVSFEIHPWQSSDRDAVAARLPLIGRRLVRSSTGHEEERFVVATTIRVVGLDVTAELTLTNRDAMGFRMLIGREALRGRVLVDPDRSYLGGRAPRSVRRRNSAC